MKTFKKVMLVFCAVMIMASFYSVSMASSHGGYTLAAASGKAYGDEMTMNANPNPKIRYRVTPTCTVSDGIAYIQCYSIGTFGIANEKPLGQNVNVGVYSAPYWLSCPNGTYSLDMTPKNNYMSSGVRATITCKGYFENY